LRKDIEATRADLADTVEALAAKGDLKARAKGKVAGVKAAAGEQAGQAAQTTKAKAAQIRRQAKETTASLQAPMVRRSGAAAAVVAAGLVLVWVQRRRARRDTNPWHRMARTARMQIRSVRGQAKAQARVARRQVEQRARMRMATTKSKAKPAKVRAKTSR
jgi:hypothetical protein